MPDWYLQIPDDMLLMCFIVLLCILFCLKYAKKSIKKKKARLWLPGYYIIYTDQAESVKKTGIIYHKLLYSSKYDIQGKPDYIFKNIFGKLVPAEIKSGSIGQRATPYQGDLLQLTAYFLLTQEEFSKKPKFGLLIYHDYMFVVRNTWKLRRELKLTMARMREMLLTGEEWARAEYPACRHCVCRGTVCEYFTDKA